MNQANSSEVKEILIGSWLADLSNFCAYYFESVVDLNWVGFYFSDGQKLVLGPFQGKMACTTIEFNRGVCGAAFSEKIIKCVPDVHEFKDHIACDTASRSELVIPLFFKNEVFGVLDVDSPKLNRFSQIEVDLFSEGVKTLLNKNPSLHLVSTYLK